MDKVPPSCPDPEALAAWLDQGVSDTEREHIEAHLAACDDCRVLVACVLESQTAVLDPGVVAAQAVRAGQPAPVHSADASAPRGVTVFPRTRVVWGAGSVVAAAAALFLSLQIAPSWWASWRTDGVEQRLADLADAVGNERTVEARLTGGFRYGPLRAPVRSGGSSASTDNWTLFAAAGRIREDADRDPTAANLHALGLAHLVLGEHDGAVRALEDAVAEAPEVPQYQSDLAGAYLARAGALDRPDDLPRALGAAERAVKGDEALVEARFNRALALEALFLEEQARQAWGDYLSRDSGSAWADEARRHLEKLQGSAAQRGPSPDLARNNSPPLVTDTSVEAALDWLLRQGLPAWADAILAHDSDRAAREHSSLTAYAAQISKTSGDGFATALVDLSSGDDSTVTRRATVVRGIAAGLVQLDAEDMPGAEAALTPVCAEADGVLRLLCDWELGGIDVLRRREADADRRLKTVSAAAAAGGSNYVRGRALKLAGYRLMFKGDYAGAIQPYREAYDAFRMAQCHRQSGFMSAQLADLFDLVGLGAEGWRWRLLAFHVAAQTGDVPLRYLTRLMTAEMLARREEREASAVFINAIGEGDVRALPPLKRAILLISRARILLANGDLGVARASLVTVGELVKTSGDFRMSRVMPDVFSLRAAIEELEARPERARESLSEAIAVMGPERAAHRATALIARAGLSTHPGQVQALDDVNQAIALLRNRAVAPAGQPLRFDEAASAFRAAAALIKSTPEFQGPRGLQLVEQLREMLDGVPRGPSPRRDVSVADLHTDPTQAIVFYLFSNDSLLTWTISGPDIRFAELRVTAKDIARLVNLLTVQLDRSPEREALWGHTLSLVYDAVLRDVPSVAGKTDLIVIPDGPLNRVPFGALFDSRANQFLFDRVSVRIVPNLAFALLPPVSVDATAPLTAAAIGDPLLSGPGAAAFQRLPRAKSEAQSVAHLYATATVVVGKEATKARVLEALASADVVHYAGHAVQSAAAAGPRLLLAGDVSDPKAALSGSDLGYRVSRPIKVILAACETAAAPIDRAAGVASLSAAFLRAGAGSVVATLWELDDSASEPFFLNVHRSLIAGHSTATAVARAQRMCRASEQCRQSAGTWIGTTVYGMQ